MGKKRVVASSQPATGTSSLSRLLAFKKKVLLGTKEHLSISILLFMLLDILFYLAVYWLITSTAQSMMDQHAALNLPDELTAISPEQATAMLAEAKGFLSSLIWSVLGVCAGIIVLWTVFKGTIWGMLMKQRLSLSFYLNMLALNGIWLGLWMALLLIFSTIADLKQIPYAIIAGFLLFLMLGNSIYAFFIPERTFQNVKQAIFFTFKKLHLIFPPYVILLLLFSLLTKPFPLLGDAAIGGFPLAQLLLFFFTMCYLALARCYALALVQVLREEKI